MYLQYYSVHIMLELKGTTREDQIKGIIEVFSTKKGKSKIVYKTDKLIHLNMLWTFLRQKNT